MGWLRAWQAHEPNAHRRRQSSGKNFFSPNTVRTHSGLLGGQARSVDTTNQRPGVPLLLEQVTHVDEVVLPVAHRNPRKIRQRCYSKVSGVYGYQRRARGTCHLRVQARQALQLSPSIELLPSIAVAARDTGSLAH